MDLWLPREEQVSSYKEETEEGGDAQFILLPLAEYACHRSGEGALHWRGTSASREGGGDFARCGGDSESVWRYRGGLARLARALLVEGDEGEVLEDVSGDGQYRGRRGELRWCWRESLNFVRRMEQQPGRWEVAAKLAPTKPRSPPPSHLRQIYGSRPHAF